MPKKRGKKKARKTGSPRGRTASRAKAGPTSLLKPPTTSLQAPATDHLTPTEIVAARQLFWDNVIREILTSLSMLCAMRPSAPESPAEKDAAADAAAEGQLVAPPPADPDGFDPSLFDGRLAVMTKGDERVAIADIYPLFACGVNTPRERGLSVALECTVFQIRTPNGHVFTLPLHEIRSFHAMTPELMQRLERAARRRRRSGRETTEEQLPFGFAAFTSTLQAAPRLPDPAPEQPLE